MNNDDDNDDKGSDNNMMNNSNSSDVGKMRRIKIVVDGVVDTTIKYVVASPKEVGSQRKKNLGRRPIQQLKTTMTMGDEAAIATDDMYDSAAGMLANAEKGSGKGMYIKDAMR